MGIIASAVHTPLDRNLANWHLLYLPLVWTNRVDPEQNAECMIRVVTECLSFGSF